MGGISIWQLLIILVIVLLLFGTKRLRNLGGDLGGAIKGFKKAIKEEPSEQLEADQKTDAVAGQAESQPASAEKEKQPTTGKKA